MRPKLSIITVSNNKLYLLCACLNSIKKTGAQIPKEVIVVDNASQDNTQQVVTQKFPFVTTIKNTHELGYATNNNNAIKRVVGKYILLLNPDTELLPKALNTMIHFMDTHKKVGICGPQLLNPDLTIQFSCRRFPTWKTFLVRRTPFRYLIKNCAENSVHLMKDINHNVMQEVDWILGGCMCIRKKMIEDIGTLDENFFLYVEDIDYCLRAWQAGWKVYYVPSAKVIHHHQAKSDKKLFSIYSKYHMRSMLHFVLKHGLFPRR